MEKLIKVINNKDRYFNGARKGGILTVPENKANYYLQNGFSLVQEAEEKKNIVTDKTPTAPKKTKAELMEILNHLGVDFDKKSNLAELEALVQEAEEKKKAEELTKKGDETGVTLDLEKIKKQLTDDKIITEEDLANKKDEEIMQLAKDNGLID